MGGRGLLHDLYDLLFPPDPVCPHCSASYKPLGFQVLCTPCCHELELLDGWRPLPLHVPDVAAVAALGPYRGALRRAVHRLKFREDRRLGLALGYLMGALALEHPRVRRVDGLVPVPLHGERAWRRGFNQASVLGQGLARMLDKPLWEGGLARPRPTRQQARLPEGERRRNVADAFQAPPWVARRRILLIDDVVTTGATLQAAARALKAAGAAEVYAIVVAAAGTIRDGEESAIA